MQRSETLRVVWSVDPFEQIEPGNPSDRAAKLLGAWARRLPIAVHPVYVLTPAQLGAQDEVPTPWIHQYRPAAERAMQDAISRTGLQSEKPVVLVDGFTTARQSTEALSRYALSIGADFIVAHTHGRGGIQRWILGSFTETLLARSEVPVVIVSPESELSTIPESILFATDFEPRARTALRSVVELAKRMRGKLILHHCVPHPIEPVFQSGVYLLGGTWIPVQSYFLAERRRVERRARAWTRWAMKQGVPATLHIERDEVQITRSIAKTARELNVGLIAMESRRGLISSALVGSVTREVMRHAPCPVWVTRPDIALAAGAAKALPGRAA